MATVIPDDVQSFKAAFEVFDHDKTGEISYEDFPNAVRAIGFNPTNNQVVEVLKAANKGEKDKINFDEFVDMLGKFNECRKEDAEESLREAFKLVSKTLSSVFFFFLQFQNVFPQLLLLFAWRFSRVQNMPKTTVLIARQVE